LDDSGLRLDDLAEGPQCDPVAVRQAAPLPPDDQLGVGVDDPRQLVDEPALADPGDAHDGHELWHPLVPDAFEGVAEHVELALASDQTRSRPVRASRSTSPRKCSCAETSSHTGMVSACPFAATAGAPL